MLNLSITLEIIGNYSCMMHREYHDFYGVHVYLRSIRISLLWATDANLHALMSKTKTYPNIGCAFTEVLPSSSKSKYPIICSLKGVQLS